MLGCVSPEVFMDRRRFLIGAGRTLLVLPFGTFLVHCSKKAETDIDPNDPTPPQAQPRMLGNNGVYTSSLDNSHSHSFTVPSSAFGDTPPIGGVVGYTSSSQNHSHSVNVTEEALRHVGDGQIAKVVTSKDLNHTHTFTFWKIG
jgi:hypothetical protein